SAFFNKNDFGVQKVDTIGMIEPYCSSGIMMESSPFPIGEDKYLIIERYIDDGQLIFRYVDKELNVLEEFYSDTFSFIPNSIMFSAASPDNKMFLFCYRVLSDTEPDRMWYLLLNERAETVNIIRKDLEETAPVLEVLKWDTEGVYFVQVKFHTDYNNLARIDSRLAEYYMEYNGGLTLVKEFPINIDRFISAMQSKFIDGKYYLFKIQEGGTKLNDVPPDGLRYRYDPAASAISYMLIDKETFGIPSSSQDVEISRVSLFPNPSSGTFHLEAEGMQGYDISLQDIMGRRVWQSTISHEGKVEADLTYLPAGLYPYTITLEGRVVYRGKWLKK
ncbi:MAG TPA: T9SS type A sorting domain-containing protein, partial [Saprospiraceae bacterium]|nr:T9SS type A sorting domain-containing protein [Saprospiraceae bacterium]